MSSVTGFVGSVLKDTKCTVKVKLEGDARVYRVWKPTHFVGRIFASLGSFKSIPDSCLIVAGARVTLLTDVVSSRETPCSLECIDYSCGDCVERADRAFGKLVASVEWLAPLMPGPFEIAKCARMRFDDHQRRLDDRLEVLHRKMSDSYAPGKTRFLADAAQALRAMEECFRFREMLVADVQRLDIPRVSRKDIDEITRIVAKNQLSYERFREDPLARIKAFVRVRVGSAVWRILNGLSEDFGVDAEKLQVHYVDCLVSEMTSRVGHMCVPLADLRSAVAGRRASLSRDLERIVRARTDFFVVEEGDYVYRREDYAVEHETAYILATMLGNALPRIVVPRDGDGLLSSEQLDAVEVAVNTPLSIVTGGSGTGKSTVVKHMCELLLAHSLRALLLAPTGKAAERLRRVVADSGGDAESVAVMTIHRAVCTRNGALVPKFDCVVIDEMSMVDAKLFCTLLRCMRRDGRLCLIGDPDQLPSIDAGDVLAQLLMHDVSGAAVCHLTKVFRQRDDGNAIWLLADDIRDPARTKMRRSSLAASESVAWYDVSDQAAIAEEVTRIVAGARDGEDVQVLVPCKPAIVGRLNLNLQIHGALHGVAHDQVVANDDGDLNKLLRKGDRIVVTRNDNVGLCYFNGQIGRVQSIDAQRAFAAVLLEGADVATRIPMDDIAMGYVTSVHKAQGSEYDTVVVVFHSAHARMLSREIAYTGITRAKRKLHLFADREALALVKLNGRPHRHSLLARMMRRIFDQMTMP